MLEIVRVNLFAGWLGVLGGVASGAALGLYYHRDDWLGGYASFRRRMARLGHISFFGIGFLNLMFAFSIRAVEILPFEAQLASLCLILGLIAMPLCCFLTAWRKPLRHLFFIPVTSLSIGIIALLAGLRSA